MWDEDGLSAAQIARVLNADCSGISRNAVIGKATRLNLTRRASSSNTTRPRGYQFPVHRLPKPAPLPVIVEAEEPLTFEDGSHVTVETVNDRTCRWPVGDPNDEHFHFCGRSPKTHSPYCEPHAHKAYQPKKPRDPKHDARRSDGRLYAT